MVRAAVPTRASCKKLHTHTHTQESPIECVGSMGTVEREGWMRTDSWVGWARTRGGLDKERVTGRV
jgi:hypothetical protein